MDCRRRQSCAGSLSQEVSSLWFSWGLMSSIEHTASHKANRMTVQVLTPADGRVTPVSRASRSYTLARRPRGGFSAALGLLHIDDGWIASTFHCHAAIGSLARRREVCLPTSFRAAPSGQACGALVSPQCSSPRTGSGRRLRSSLKSAMFLTWHLPNVRSRFA